MEENVRIVITGNNKDALNKLNKVEDAVNRLNSATKRVEVKVNGIQEAERQAARLYQALERVESAALSKLPQSLQTVIAYLKAANAGLGEFSKRAITAAAAVGEIGRVPFAPIIKAQSQAIRQFQQMERGLVSLRVEFVRVFDRGSTQPLLDGLNLVRVSVLETKGLLEGRGDFTRPILDGLDLVKVRILEIKGLLGGIGGAGGGGRIPPGVPPNAPRLPQGRPNDFVPIKTIANLERLRSILEQIYRTTEIGTPKFKELEERIAGLTQEIQDAQLRFQKVTTKATPGSIAALREEIASKQAVFEQTDRNSKKFRELGDELRRLNTELSKTERFIEGRTKGGKARLGTALQSAALGGGFPLLFGGPSFSAAGGALGGFAGGLVGQGAGFAGGIVGSALGAAVDQIAESAATLGQALNTLTADIDAVVAATGKTNTVFAQNIKALEEAGLKNTALALATQELANVVGDSGVSALKEFGSDTQRLGEVFARAMTQMQADLASLVNSLGILKGIIRGIDDAVLFRQAQESTDPRVGLALAQFRSAQKEITPGRTGQQFEKLETLRQRVVDAQRQVNEEQARNIENLSKLALQEKQNLDKAKLNLQNAERALQALNIVDKFTNQLKEQQKAQLDFETRRNDIVENYEKSIATLRRNVENQISNLRLQNLRKANQLEDQRAANVLANLRNQQAASRLFTAGPLGQDPAITQLEQNLQNAADTYSLRILEAEQKRAKLERDAALSVQEIGFRTDRFKLDVARQAAELSLNAQKQIDRINKNINQRNADFNAKKLKNEVKIAALQLEVLQAEINFEAQKLSDEKKTATAGRSDEITNQIITLGLLYSAIGDSVKELKQFELPAAFTEVQGITQATIDLSGYNAVVEESIGLQNQLKESRFAAISGELEAAGLASLKTASDALLQIENQVLGSIVARNLELEKTARISQLTKELGSKALAEEIAGIELATKAQLTKIQTIQQSLVAQQADLEAKVAANIATEQEITQLERIKELLGQIGVLRGSVAVASAVLKTEAKGEIGQFIEQATDQLNNIQAVAVSVSQGIGDAIGNSLTDGVARLTEGTATAQEVFADFLKNVAQLLLKTAAQMIATYVAIGIARKFAGLFGNGSDSSGPNIDGIQQYVNEYNSGDFTNAFSGLANGGPAKSGNPYIVGERGPELFVPRSNGRVIPNGRFGGGGGGDVNVVVNVDAKGSNAQGSDRDAKALGSAIGIAVRSELVKQKRPGGLLAS